MLGGLELLLIPLGNGILGALGALGIGTGGLTAFTLGGMAAAGLGGAGLTGLGVAGSTANPMVAGGYQAAAIDAYNNAVTGSSNFLNGLDLPFVPGVHAN